MKFVIAQDTVKVEYNSRDFWQQYDEVEVENPKGWYICYVEGGIVHTFGYSQSSGRGEYLDVYREETHKKPIRFTKDAKANAELMHKTNYDNMKAVLIREP